MIPYTPPHVNLYKSINKALQSKDDITPKLIKFGNYKEGWHFGEGSIINRPVINKAIQLYNIASDYNLTYTTHALLDGGISITAYKNDNFLEILINRDLSFDLIYEIGIGIKYKTVFEKYEADFVDLKSQLNRINSSNHSSNKNKCAFYEFYHSPKQIIVEKERDSIHQYSQTPPMGEESRLSISNALIENAHVATFNSITSDSYEVSHQ